jgi:hypothetical protein
MVMLAVLIVVAPVLAAVPDLTPEEMQHNRTLFDRWRADPEHYNRLKTRLQAFHALSKDRRDQIRQLDRDLHDEDMGTQARLWRVMDRYIAWVDQLPPEERARVNGAQDVRQRLAIVRELRDRQWIDRLPTAKRKQIVDAPTPEKKGVLLAQFRGEDQNRRLEWQKVGAPREDVPLKKGPVLHRVDLPPEIKHYLDTKLDLVLSDNDKKRLKDAEGKWPQFGKVLRDLIEKHPLTLPGPTTGISTHQALPGSVQRKLRELKGPKKQEEREKLRNHLGKWPDYAIAVTELIRRWDPPMPEELGPAKLTQFSSELQQFVKTKLTSALNDDEKKQLTDADGKWPELPQTIQKLSLKYHLPIPGLPLPGPHEFWDRLKVASTDVPTPELQNFAKYQLSQKERSEMKLGFGDPESMHRLKQAYLEWQAKFQHASKDRGKSGRKER